MNDEKWQDIISQMKDNDKIEQVDHRLEELPEEMGPGTREIIEFKGPLGLMRLERTTQPLVVDKKTIGSRRIGSDTKVEYIYSDTEKVHKFKAYRWDENSQVWVEMQMNRGEMSF